MIQRMRINEKLCENQRPFERNMECIEHISTMKIISEQIKEMGEDLYA